MPEVRRHKLFIGGRWLETSLGTTLPVTSPYLGKTVAETDQADPGQMESCLTAAASAFQVFRRSSRFARAQILKKMAEGFAGRRSELRGLIIHEAGKPFRLADIEVDRAIQTFTLAAEEARRFAGELLPIDLDQGSCGYAPVASYWQARGPVLAIAPFNFPLDLMAHKVAPALAVGAPVICKPPPQAPGAAVVMGKFCAASLSGEIPAASMQVIHAPNEVLASAVTEPWCSQC